MQSQTDQIMAMLAAGKIPDSIAGLDYYDLQPSRVLNPKFEQFDIVKKCSEIMVQDPSQADKGRNFLENLYGKIIAPAFDKTTSKVETTGTGTLIHWAAATGQLTSMNFLHLAGQDIAPLNTPNEKKQTPFELALQNGHLDVAVFLLERGVMPNEALLSQAVQVAAARGHLPLVDKIIQIGQPAAGGPRDNRFLNPQNIAHSPLLAAYQTGQLQVASALIHAGANPARYGTYERGKFLYTLFEAKNTPALLHILDSSLFENSDPMFHLLPMNRQIANLTPLMAACQHGDIMVATRLLEMGSNPLHQYNGKSALSIAQENNNPGLIALFKPYQDRYEESRKFLDRVEAEFADRKKPMLPRNKLKHELIDKILAKLREVNEGLEKGRETVEGLRNRPILVSELNLSPKDEAAFKEHLQIKQMGAVQHADSKATLQDVLDFQRRPGLDKKRGVEHPKSSQQIMREMDPATMRQDAIKFLDDVIRRLKEKKDIAPRHAKREEMKGRRLEKITALEGLREAINQNENIRTVKDLCECTAPQDPNTLLSVLQRHQDPAKTGKKDTKSYQEFYKLFRLDKHPEVHAQLNHAAAGRKAVSSLEGEPPRQEGGKTPRK